MALWSEHRYKGLQSLLKQVGSDGCYFLCLVSIAEDFLCRSVDLVDALSLCLATGCLKDDMYVADATMVLNKLTGRVWHREIRKELGKVADDEYTVVKYFNPRTAYTHFKRRPYDTLDHSVTVEQGRVEAYYVFKVV